METNQDCGRKCHAGEDDLEPVAGLEGGLVARDDGDGLDELLRPARVAVKVKKGGADLGWAGGDFDLCADIGRHFRHWRRPFEAVLLAGDWGGRLVIW